MQNLKFYSNQPKLLSSNPIFSGLDKEGKESKTKFPKTRLRANGLASWLALAIILLVFSWEQVSTSPLATSISRGVSTPTNPKTTLSVNLTGPNLATARTGHQAILLTTGKVLVVGGNGVNNTYPGNVELFDPQSGSWASAGTITGRAGHTTTLLNDGRVLLLGGYNASGLVPEVEIYNPQTNSWAVVSFLNPARYEHTATLLKDGRVLVVGGYNNTSYMNSVKIYDPQTNSWTDADHSSPFVARSQHTASLLPDGRVLVAGGKNTNTSDVLASTFLYNVLTDTWTQGADMGSAARRQHIALTLDNGDILVSGGYVSGNQYMVTMYAYNTYNNSWYYVSNIASDYRAGHTLTILKNGKVLQVGGINLDTITYLSNIPLNTWIASSNLNISRYDHTATLLADGRVLIVGGTTTNSTITASVEFYDPLNAFDGWKRSNDLQTARYAHTATLLQTGKVLIVGGYKNQTPATYLADVELYDPLKGTSRTIAALSVARGYHTATLLPNGKVLIVGGVGNGGFYLNSAEIFDPLTESWTFTSSMASGRAWHTATRLTNGKVLVVGGKNGPSTTAFVSTAELYDGLTGNWSSAGTLLNPRINHTTTLLSDGQVLVVGGRTLEYSILDKAELYNPQTNSWRLTAPLPQSRELHTATILPNKQVAIVGGSSDNGSLTYIALLYNPATETWQPAAQPAQKRIEHSAILLPNGKLLVAGGTDLNGQSLKSAELYDPDKNYWFNLPDMSFVRHAFPLLMLPDGKVMATGGRDALHNEIKTIDFFEPAQPSYTRYNMLQLRYYHTTTLLPSGNVLIVGGYRPAGGLTSSVEIFNPVTGVSAYTGSLNVDRYGHTATLLADGRVLVAGGQGQSAVLYSAEVYDPATGIWTLVGNMQTPRTRHRAVLLFDGKVLVIGGLLNNSLGSAELYDPVTQTWSATTSMNVARYEHTATLLPSGKVLVAGGFSSSALNYTEVYNPADKTWVSGNNLPTAVAGHQATLWSNNNVALAGGYSNGGAVSSVTVLDSNTTAAVGSYGQQTNRAYFSFVALLNGKAVALGGTDVNNNRLGTAEIIDPASYETSFIRGLTARRSNTAATLLTDGRVLIAGGADNEIYSNMELYSWGLNYQPEWQPVVETWPSYLPVSSTTTLINLMGSGFAARGENSSGAASATNYPLLQFYSLTNAQSHWLTITNWTTTTIQAKLPPNLPLGYGLLVVYVNGIPSTPRLVGVQVGQSTQLNLVGSSNIHNAVVGEPLFFTATVSALNPITIPITGNITLKTDSGTTLANASLNANAQATFSLNNLVAGVYTITAQYNPSSTTYLPASSNQLVAQVSNPLPVVTALLPTSAQLGSSSFTLQVNGIGFVDGAQVRWNGANRLTTYISPTRITAAIPTNDLNVASPQNIEITVFNPAPGGGEAVALTFKILPNTPGAVNVPVITNLTPEIVIAGSGDFSLQVDGANFTANSIVYYNGQPRSTGFTSSERLTAQLTAQDVQKVGIGLVQVYTTGSGSGQYSAYKILKIVPATTPTPTVIATDPLTLTRGGPAFTLQVYGTNFTANSVVLWNGSPRTTLYLSQTLLLADIANQDIANNQPITAEIKVQNSDLAGTTLLNSNSYYVNLVDGCIPNLVTSLADGEGCGSLRSAVAYASLAGNNPTINFAVLRGSQFNLTNSLTITKNISVRVPCGQAGVPQYGIKFAVDGGAGLIISNATTNPIKLGGFLIESNSGLPVKVNRGVIQLSCLKINRN